MTWETILPRTGTRSGQAGVSAAWRHVGGSGYRLVITIADDVRRQLGLEAGWRMIAQRDRLANKLRLEPSRTEGWLGHRRAWNNATDGSHCVVYNVPLDDLRLTEIKRAQSVAWEISGGSLIIKLPPWCAVMVHVSGGRAA